MGLLQRFKDRNAVVRTADSSTSPQVRGQMVVSGDTDVTGDRLLDFNRAQFASGELADPIDSGAPHGIYRMPDVNPGLDHWEPPSLETRPTWLRIAAPDPLVVHDFTGEQTPAHVNVIPKLGERDQGRENHARIPRRILDDEVVRPAGAAWQPNSGKVMTSRGPLADPQLVWETMPAQWNPNGASVTPTLAGRGFTAAPVNYPTTLTPWESHIAVDEGQ